MGKKDKRLRAGAASTELAGHSGAPPPAAAQPQAGWAEAVTGRARIPFAAARMCFGKPVQAAGLTMVPVASVRSVGGGGWSRRGDGADSPADSSSGGAPPTRGSHHRRRGGYLHARPLGFIEIGPEGVRYQPLDRPSGGGRAATAGLALLGALLAAGTLAPRLLGRRSLRPLRAAPSPRRLTRR